MRKFFSIIFLIIFFSFISLFLLSWFGVIWSSREDTTMFYNVDIVKNQDNIKLIQENYIKAGEFIGEKIISENKDDDTIMYTIRDNGFNIELWSTGVTGGSYHWSSTRAIEILINNQMMTNQYEGGPILYSVFPDAGDYSEVNISMSYKNPYLFAQKQSTDLTMRIHWLSDEEFEQLKQEKLREQEN